MRNTATQQLIEWTSTHAPRPVAIDLTEEDRETASRAAERHENKGETAVAGRVSTGPGRGDDARRATDRLDCLTREQLLDEIISSNPSATVSFLSDFGDRGLRNYLGRLRSCSLGRGRSSMFEREAESPAIVARMRRD